MPNEQNDDEELSKLLRLKRFEQPSPEYYETFLREFKDRQRAQLLREPVWRIAWDRMIAFFGEQLLGRVGYGLASTAVLIAAGIASLNILESRPVEVVASASAPDVSEVHAPAQPASLNLNTAQVQLPDLPSPAPTTSFSTPRYVMDAQPVSYERQSSF